MALSPTITLFADRLTADALTRPANRILLLGGYLGYANFGDILQLRGAIDWHRRRDPSIDPVIVCDTGAATDLAFVTRLRAAFDVEHLVFAATNSAPLSHGPSLVPLASPARIERLHLYGGGYLNRQWGRHMLACAQHIIAQFAVGHYVMSGQQTDAGFAGDLAEHVQACRPVLVGARDDQSLQVLRHAGAPAVYSFDDAAEQIGVLKNRISRRVTSPNSPPTAVFHFNVSTYAAGGTAAVESLMLRAQRLMERISAEHALLLNAYNDARVAHVADTLGVMQRTGDRCPWADYRVIDLAIESLHLGRAAIDGPGDPQAASAFITHPAPPTPAASPAMVCSYHAAMLCQMLGIPVWLEVRNPYYAQKAAGLGLDRFEFDAAFEPARSDAAFLDFLRDLPVTGLSRQLAGRAAWLEELAGAYRAEPGAPLIEQRLPTPVRATDPVAHASTPDAAPTPSDINSTGGDLSHRVAELQSWIEQLEAGKSWLSSQLQNYKALASRHEQSAHELTRYVQELEARVARQSAESDALRSRLATAQEHLQAAMNRAAQLQGGVDWLQPQYRAWKTRADELHRYVEELLPTLKQADDARAWSDSQRQTWESLAKKLQSENKELAAELERARAAVGPDRG
ncbi:MAG: hypothetical protein AB7G11_14055 [Phycisphaerales bacterium]